MIRAVWHSMEIVLDRDTVIVSVDGKVTTWARTEWVDGLREKSPKGRIGFQGNHSDPEQWVRFRNVRIRDLDGEVDYALRGFRRTDPQIRRTAYAATLQHGAAAVPGLVELVAGPDSARSAASREALFAIVAEASAPDASPDSRASVRKALDEERNEAESPVVKGYLGWLSGMLE